MTKEIFRWWINSYFVPAVSAFLKDKKLPPKAVLLLDNAPVHPINLLCCDEDLDLKVCFLPKNCSCILQPMDQSVIRSFKSFYSRNLMCEMYFPNGIDNEVRTFKSKTEYDQYWKSLKIDKCIMHVADAWDEIPKTTFHKAWKKVWPFLFQDDSNSANNFEMMPQLSEHEAMLMNEFNEITSEKANAYDVICENVSSLNENELQILSLSRDLMLNSEANEDEDEDESLEYDCIVYEDGSVVREIAANYSFNDQLKSVLYEHDYTQAEWNVNHFEQSNKKQHDDKFDDIGHKFRKLSRTDKLKCIQFLSNEILLEDS